MQTEGSSILIKGGCILTEWWAAGVVLDTFVFETCIDVSPTILLCGCAGISRWHWPTSPSTVLVSTSFASRCVFHPLYYVTFNIPQHCCTTVSVCCYMYNCCVSLKPVTHKTEMASKTRTYRAGCVIFWHHLLALSARMLQVQRIWCQWLAGTEKSVLWNIC